MTNENEIYMKRALELAKLGRGNVSPNPMVGCVIVYNGEIIGEGYHQNFGQAHAEVNAIQSVKNKNLLAESTLYVTLEPCNHFGKTPPCTDLILRHRIKKVIVAVLDSNPLVHGKGIKKLKDAGVEVEYGVLEKDAKELNCRFDTFFTKNRPYIILKWAQTQDGFLARKDYSSKWISNEYSRQWTHKMRAEEDAILVGFKTAMMDNPFLNVRNWHGKNPAIVLIDKKLDLKSDSNVFKSHSKVFVFNCLKNENQDNISFVKVQEENLILELLKVLKENNIQSLIVEGGAKTIQQFLKNNLWDEASIFISNTVFKEGIEAPKIEERFLFSKNMILDDNLYIYRNEIN